MRIAEAIGGRTLDELEETLTFAEYMEWVEEFGRRASEERQAMKDAQR